MNNHAPITDDTVDRAVVALREITLDDQPPPALLARTVAAVDAAARAPRPRLAARLGRPLIAIAAAAALATAAAVMIAVVLPFGSGSGSAFAAMLDKVREMKSVRYRVTGNAVDGAVPVDAISFVVTETTGGARCETGSRVTIFSGDGLLILDTKAKTAATVSAEEGGPPRAKRPDLLAQFREADGGLGEPIEGKQVGPVAARGYRVTKPRNGEGDAEVRSMQVYVDPATELPVQVEQEVRLSDDDKSQRFASVLSDFEWDIEVDPALLSLDPPAGYRYEKSDREAVSEVSPPEAVAAGLRFYAKHLKGALPSGIDGFEPMIALQSAMLDDAARKELAALDMGALLKIPEQLFGPWLGLMGALDDLEQQNIKVHYLGKGLEEGDGSKIVAWWKAERPGRAIAVYDDFSWKEIDEPAAAPSP